jgi:hypothetical protein
VGAAAGSAAAKTTSIGAFMEVLDEDVLDELDGAQIGLQKL